MRTSDAVGRSGGRSRSQQGPLSDKTIKRAEKSPQKALIPASGAARGAGSTFGPASPSRPAPRRVLYHVLFDQPPIWQEGAAGDTVLVEIFEHWLEPAAPERRAA